MAQNVIQLRTVKLPERFVGRGQKGAVLMGGEYDRIWSPSTTLLSRRVSAKAPPLSLIN